MAIMMKQIELRFSKDNLRLLIVSMAVFCIFAWACLV